MNIFSVFKKQKNGQTELLENLKQNLGSCELMMSFSSKVKTEPRETKGFMKPVDKLFVSAIIPFSREIHLEAAKREESRLKKIKSLRVSSISGIIKLGVSFVKILDEKDQKVFAAYDITEINGVNSRIFVRYKIGGKVLLPNSDNKKFGIFYPIKDLSIQGTKITLSPLESTTDRPFLPPPATEKDINNIFKKKAPNSKHIINKVFIFPNLSKLGLKRSEIEEADLENVMVDGVIAWKSKNNIGMMFTRPNDKLQQFFNLYQQNLSRLKSDYF